MDKIGILRCGIIQTLSIKVTLDLILLTEKMYPKTLDEKITSVALSNFHKNIKFTKIDFCA